MTVPVTRKLPKLRDSDFDPYAFLKRGWFGCLTEKVKITEFPDVVFDAEKQRYRYDLINIRERYAPAYVFLKCTSRSRKSFSFHRLGPTIWPEYNRNKERVANVPTWDLYNRALGKRLTTRLFVGDMERVHVADPAQVPIKDMIKAALDYGLSRASKEATQNVRFRIL